MPPLVEVASACWRLPHLQTSEGQLQEAQAPTAEMSEVAAWPTTPFCAIALENNLAEVSIIGWMVGCSPWRDLVRRGTSGKSESVVK